ncbi:MAG: alpha/beta hydrolase family protein [Leptolyngbyaceae cyanobacterium]
MTTANLGKTEASLGAAASWQSPPQEILDVLYGQHYPRVWTAPNGEHLLLTDLVLYPTLAELAAPMHRLAGIQVNPATNGHYNRRGGTTPRLIRVRDGLITAINWPADTEVHDVRWTADGERVALIVKHPDHIGLWLGSVAGELTEVQGVALNPLLGNPVSWHPDQQRLLLRRLPERGPVPSPPAIPTGPDILEGAGATARSTYEARNLLETAHDAALFDYYTLSELVLFDPMTGDSQIIGKPAPYTKAQFSPSGDYLLVQRLVEPWSYEVAWWRFASEIEVWNSQGEKVAAIASLPVADAVPVHGVPTGPRAVVWQPTAPHTLVWVEALDGGFPRAEVPYRDQLLRLAAPFDTTPQVVFKAEHRIQPWRHAWSADGHTLMLTQWERLRRWRYVWLLDVDQGTARKWFDLNESDRYSDPGTPLLRTLPNGRRVLRQRGNAIYFSGDGASDQGDRPFLDLRDLDTGETKRLFHCDPERYEYFVGFVGDETQFILRSESPFDFPNYYLATLALSADQVDQITARIPITQFTDPTPQLRQIQKRIVRYERADGVPLSFHLYVPPDYEPGKPLPTVLYAYPLEYSDGAIAGQVSGSDRRFMRLYGASHLFFLLQGYAVLDQTAMPMLGDPETAYDTFVPQLVADAEAAVKQAVDMGIADPERIGIIGHSHGGLMVANLLAHTDLFRAGIARSGSYNKTNQPFGFQAERRSLFEAQETYIQVSPTFFADQIDEPILIIHGKADSNPGTLTAQSEVFYEAVRGSGGTTRLVLLPFEDHGYRARETIEHVLWEQFQWFDQHLKPIH